MNFDEVYFCTIKLKEIEFLLFSPSRKSPITVEKRDYSLNQNFC